MKAKEDDKLEFENFIEKLIKENYDTLVTIERSSAAKDSKYYTMKGIDISDFLAPWIKLFYLCFRIKL